LPRTSRAASAAGDRPGSTPGPGARAPPPFFANAFARTVATLTVPVAGPADRRALVSIPRGPPQEDLPFWPEGIDPLPPDDAAA
jgi:hypothetical protein